ncbi:response regulator transcription factor [Thalassobaculum sp.]|uniref:response regulator transcription factor n=1 Tax=Thalassobaculum sp. TaxID=2022740 RepID=UPI0032ED3C06
MDRQAHILVVEDDEIVRTLLAATLEMAGYDVSTAGSGVEMTDMSRNHDYSLILMDLGLPDEDGIVLLRQLRARDDVPVIILTSRDDMPSRRTALKLGADDYINKDVHPEEIILRIRNVLRRGSGRGGTTAEQPDHDAIKFSGWHLDPVGRSLTSPSGAEITLTGAEFDVLCVLARAPNRVLSRDQLLDGLMRLDDAPTDRMIDSYISRIRKKMNDSRFIVTVTGVGYRFVPEPG